MHSYLQDFWKILLLSLTFYRTAFPANTCRKIPIEIHFIYFANKEIYCIFKTFCISSVSFSTKCYLFHNFIFFCTNNVFHKWHKNLNTHPSRTKVNLSHALYRSHHFMFPTIMMLIINIWYISYNYVPGILTFSVTPHHIYNKACKPKVSSHHFVHILLHGSLAISLHSRIPQLGTSESVFHALCRSCYCKHCHH